MSTSAISQDAFASKEPSLFYPFGDALGDGDGAGGADEAAQVAADALAAHEVRLAVVAEGDGLVSAVHAGNITPAAADAFLAVEDGEDDGVTVQVAGLDKAGDLFAHQGRELGDATACHVVLQSQFQVVDDAVAILHDGGAHLQIAASQLDELEGVAPGLDAADAGSHIGTDAVEILFLQIQTAVY